MTEHILRPLQRALPRTAQLGRIHRQTSGPLIDALAAVPEYAEARNALASLEPIGPAVHGTGEAAVARLLADAISAGDDVTSPEFAATAAQIHAEAVGGQHIAAAAETLRLELGTRLDQAVRSNLDTLNAALGTALEALLTEARDLLAALGDRTDLRSAVDAGKLDEYDRLNDLGADYALLRRQQGDLFAAVENRGRAFNHTLCAFLADPAAADPEFHARRRGEQVPNDNGPGTRLPHPVPWPDLSGAEALVWPAPRNCIHASPASPAASTHAAAPPRPTRESR